MILWLNKKVGEWLRERDFDKYIKQVFIGENFLYVSTSCEEYNLEVSSFVIAH